MACFLIFTINRQFKYKKFFRRNLKSKNRKSSLFKKYLTLLAKTLKKHQWFVKHNELGIDIFF